MATSSLHNPHDKLFKLSLKRRASALDFLRHHAPPQLLEEIDIATLELKPDTFVTKEYQDLESDVVYGVQTKHGKGYLYFLMEHQTQEDKDMPIRLLEYMAQLMRLHLKQKDSSGKLPEVYALVLYAGDASSKGPKSLEETFGRAGAMQRMGTHVYLIDLVRMASAELLKHGEVALTELALKEGRKNPTAFLRKHCKLINGSVDGRVVLFYLVAWLQGEAREAFIREVGILAPKDKDYIMNGLQEIRQEGRQEGIQQERMAVALNLRKQGISPSVIKKATGVSARDLDSRQ